MIGTSDIDEEALGRLIPLFYDRIRQDPLLGPVFDGAVHDWPAHLETLIAFWSSVMLTSGRYKGNPMRAHLAHRDTITPEMFERWLTLWAEITDRHMPQDSAVAMQAKAARIAESLQLALFFRLDPPARQATA
ncbi:MAG: group III truncated hemoglobin [Sphingobium sp.]